MDIVIKYHFNPFTVFRLKNGIFVPDNLYEVVLKSLGLINIYPKIDIYI